MSLWSIGKTPTLSILILNLDSLKVGREMRERCWDSIPRQGKHLCVSKGGELNHSTISGDKSSILRNFWPEKRKNSNRSKRSGFALKVKFQTPTLYVCTHATAREINTCDLMSFHDTVTKITGLTWFIFPAHTCAIRQFERHEEGLARNSHTAGW